MLLFRPEHISLILNGTKTQTRRLWDKPRAKVGSIQKCYSGGMPFSKCKPCKGLGYWEEPDKTECPECNGTGFLQPFASILVKRVWRQYLCDITWEEARVEGYQTLIEYYEAFYRINTKKLPKTWWCKIYPYVVEFELVKEAVNEIEGH